MIYTVIFIYKIPEAVFGNTVWLNVIYNFILLVGLIFLLRYLLIKRVIKQFKITPQLTGEREIILNDEVLIIKTPVTRSEYNYKAIYNFELVQDYCYVYLNEQNAIIIPRSAPGFDYFVKVLKEKLKCQ
jgi:hypothetical protein